MNERLSTKDSVFIIISFLILVILSSCEKYDSDITGDINFFLLDEYETEGIRGVINDDGLVLHDEPIIFYGELLEYNSVNHSFTLDPEASARINNQFGSAFAVSLEDEVIYTGYFWSGFSSAIVDWVVIDLLEVEGSNKMNVKLGYPYMFEGVTIPDNRNHNRLLSVFARDDKLID